MRVCVPMFDKFVLRLAWILTHPTGLDQITLIGLIVETTKINQKESYNLSVAQIDLSHLLQVRTIFLGVYNGHCLDSI
jgi:hypothetical protein